MKSKRIKKKKEKKSGAIREPNRVIKPTKKLLGIFRLIQKVLVFTVVGSVLYYTYIYVDGWLDVPVDDVLVKGEFLLVPKQDVADRIYTALEGGFIQLDLNRVRASIKENPWVDRVVIKKRWPNTLAVTVIEHKPIARWGDEDFLSHRGEVIVLDDKYGNADLSQLPLLFGPVGHEQRVMEQYQLLMKLMAVRNLMITELIYNKSLGWKMVLNEVQINIGRDRVVERLNKFIAVYDKHLKGRWLELNGVDLRYEVGLTASWKTVKEI